MPRKGENIYKRKDGRWEGRYKMGRKKNGQLKYGYLYGPTYSNVRERLYVYKLKYQTIINLQGNTTMSYEEWSLFWLTRNQNRIKVSTYSTYFYKLKRYVFPFIGEQPMNQLTKEHIQEMIDSWELQGLKPTTIHVLYQIVRKTLNDALNQQYILQSPCLSIMLPKKKRNRASALSPKNQTKLENEVKKGPLYKGLPVLLALHAGLRIGEIAALKWSDIDFDRRHIYVQQTYQRVPIGVGKSKTQLVLDQSKTEQSIRTIPMSITLYKYLKKWSKKAPGLFVCSNKLTPSEPRLLTYYYHVFRKKVDLTNTHFHHLRHTFATRCIEANGDVVSVSRLLGHLSSKTTLDIYADSFIDIQRTIINQMEHRNLERNK